MAPVCLVCFDSVCSTSKRKEDILTHRQTKNLGLVWLTCLLWKKAVTKLSIHRLILQVVGGVAGEQDKVGGVH